MNRIEAVTCDCQICRRHRVFRRELKKLPAARRAFWACLYDQLNGSEMDADYYRALVEGKWPDATR